MRAHACDVLRSYLPGATLTNVGIFAPARRSNLLISFYASHLGESQGLGGAMHAELGKLIPSFVKRAKRSE